ncbi:MAG TPA: hypothetical protein V6C97_08490 [Oculatellaceae cyanobacterium]
MRYLDYVNGVVGKANLRAPCSSTGTAPFDGVKSDLDGTYIGDPTSHQPTNSAYANYTNSLILKTTEPVIFAPGSSTLSYQEEVYAQIVAFQAWVNTANNPGHVLAVPTMDGILANPMTGTYNYMPCTQYWASNILGGGQSLQSFCTSSPGTSAPFQRQPTS